jgi:hypothetical protein
MAQEQREKLVIQAHEEESIKNKNGAAFVFASLSGE